MNARTDARPNDGPDWEDERTRRYYPEGIAVLAPPYIRFRVAESGERHIVLEWGSLALKARYGVVIGMSADEPTDILNERRVSLSSNEFVWWRFGATVTRKDERVGE